MSHTTNLRFIEREQEEQSKLSVAIKKTINVYIKYPMEEKDQRFLTKVFTLIEGNIANFHYSIRDISHSLDISESQLRRRVKALTGLSPVKLIRHVRLLTASEILLSGSSVKQAMHQTGFDNASYFGEMFKNLLGTTPGAYGKEREHKP